MNEQKNDSMPQEPFSAVPEALKNTAITKKEHTSILDSITILWHKKKRENVVPIVDQIGISTTINGIVSTPVSDTVQNTVPNIATLPVPQKTHIGISEKIAQIFHNTLPVKNREIPEAKQVIEITPIVTPDVPKEAELSLTGEDRFVQLLKHDITYHAMLRGENVNNIQFQLSMRYMILMFAIFVVIAWIVNNRVIMLGFSDFPLLARTRDALFVLLTGLFSLTVWFGATAWFRNSIIIIILRIIGGLLFFTVLVSLYLPFWS